MRNSVFILLILGAILVSVWGFFELPEQLIVGTSISAETNTTSKWFVLIFLPLFMLVLYAILCLVNKLGNGKQEFNNLKSSIHAIFVSVLVILLVTHCFLIFNGTRMKLNVDMITPLVTGITFIVIGNYMPRFKETTYTMTFQPAIFHKMITEEGTRKLLFNMSRIFVVSGIFMLLTLLLPSSIGLLTFFVLLLLSVITLFLNMACCIYKFRT